MKTRIYIQLMGGIGNQLFQYSCAKNLSLKLRAEIIFDDNTGFKNDKIFKRKLELPKKLIKRRINLDEKIFFLFIKIIKKTFFKKKIFITFGNTIIIDETRETEFINNFFNLTKKYKNIYLIGFFKTEKYYLENKIKIMNSIISNLRIGKLFLNLKKQISDKSTMVGIRLFEEAPIKIRRNFGGLETLNFINNSISKIKKKDIYIFTTFDYKKKLKKSIKYNFKLITLKSGFKGNSLEYLSMMSNFKNFIITNSSFYWWAVYISEYKNKNNIKICASKKFLNKDSVPKRWMVK